MTLNAVPATAPNPCYGPPRNSTPLTGHEFGPEGIHVAHVVIDGQIDTPGVRDRFPDRDDETFLDPDEMAETYWHLVEQDDISTQPFEVHITNGPQNSEFI